MGILFVKTLNIFFFLTFFVLGLILFFYGVCFGDSLDSIVGYIIIFVSLCLFSFVLYLNNEVSLIEGETRQLRRERRKLLKLKAQKKYLETKKERQEKTAKLQCQIHELELEIKGERMTCKQCGNKIYRKSCYCPQCGVQIK